MSYTVPPVDDLLAESKGVVLPAERAMLERFDQQRRVNLLRIIVPGLLILVALALPGAVYSDVQSHSLNSTAQDGIGLIGFGLAFWALRQSRVALASYATFAGVCGVILFVLLNDTIFSGQIELSNIPEFTLFVVPIVLAGVLGGPRLVAGTTLTTATLTFLLITFTQHGPQLAARLAMSDGLVVYTVPIPVQIALGVLVIASTRGLRQTQRELSNIRVAYAREKELDRLKEQFISSVNHELRTPIMALQGYIELARSMGNAGDTVHQDAMLRRSSEVVDHLAAIVKSVLNVRRVESDLSSLHPTVFALHPAIIAATHLLDPRDTGAAERELRLQVPPNLSVFADADRVRQILVNLLSNASKYSPAGSPIEVTARPQQSTARRRESTSAPDMIEIVVRDHGLGIPPEQAILLFQRFVRLERDIASNVLGTGLGLAICKAYVQAMGGEIWIESAGIPEEGTSFIFTLPAAPNAMTMLTPTVTPVLVSA